MPKKIMVKLEEGGAIAIIPDKQPIFVPGVTEEGLESFLSALNMAAGWGVSLLPRSTDTPSAKYPNDKGLKPMYGN